MRQIWKDTRPFTRFIHNGETQNKHITIGNWLNMIIYPHAIKRDNDRTRWPENENIFRTYKRLREFTSFLLFLRKSFEVMLQHNEWVNQERQTRDPGNSAPHQESHGRKPRTLGSRPREQSVQTAVGTGGGLQGLEKTTTEMQCYPPEYGTTQMLNVKW